MSGPKINLQIYEVILIGEVDNIDLLAQVLHCPVEVLLASYLGLLLRPTIKNREKNPTLIVNKMGDLFIKLGQSSLF